MITKIMIATNKNNIWTNKIVIKTPIQNWLQNNNSNKQNKIK